MFVQQYAMSGMYIPAAGLYDGQQQVSVSRVEPPLVFSLSPSMLRLARLFAAQLRAIGVTVEVRNGQLLASTMPAVVMEREAQERRKGRPAVAVGLLQVRDLYVSLRTTRACVCL